MSEFRDPAVRIILLPRDTNGEGTIFGGVILSHIDLAGVVTARRYANHSYVTVAMDGVEFHQPVFVGDCISLYGKVIKKGRTSVTVHVSVEAERASCPGQVVEVTEADVVFVAVDGRRRPVVITPNEDGDS